MWAESRLPHQSGVSRALVATIEFSLLATFVVVISSIRVISFARLLHRLSTNFFLVAGSCIFLVLIKFARVSV